MGRKFIANRLIAELSEINKATVCNNYTCNPLKDSPYVGHSNIRKIQGDISGALRQLESMPALRLLFMLQRLLGLTQLDSIL